MTADGLRLTVYGPDEDEIGVVEVAASGPRLTASGVERVSSERSVASVLKLGDRIEPEKAGERA